MTFEKKVLRTLRGPGRGMALLDLALEGMAVFGFVLFLVLWLMHFMAIIYT